MSEEKHIIWSDRNLDYEDWKSNEEFSHPEMSEDERIKCFYEGVNDFLSDERDNLDIQLSREIIIVADLGLWNGRKSGYKMIDSGNIRDCLYSDCDTNEWYVDTKGDMRCIANHHDGTNHYLYRAIKGNATDAQVERLQNLIYSGRATRADITRVTERLGDKIGAVYGWSFPQANKNKAQVR